MTNETNSKSPSANTRKKNSTRILAIESDRYTRNFLNQSLGEFGTVKLIEHGPHVFETTKKYKPNVVVLGLEESDLNGLCLCRWLKENRPDVCIVLITNPESTSELVHDFNMIDGQITSPVDPRELKSLLCQLMEAQLRANSTRSLQKDYQHVQRNFASSARYSAELKTDTSALSSLTMIAAMKDQGASHLKRVQAMSQCIAMQLRNESIYSGKITDAFLQDLNEASQLHDIGNVVIGDELLNHSGTLTDREYETIQMHTTFGADLLEQACAKSPESTALQMAQRIARAHHEHWNGEGYPQKLVGEQIPLEARIVAVADVFDALTSNRSFRDSFTPELARNVIGNESGKQFDPVVVEAFMETFESIQATADAINDLARVESESWTAEQHVEKSIDDTTPAGASTRAIEEYRQQQRELVDKFREVMSSRIDELKQAYFDGEHDNVERVAEELQQTAAEWGLTDAPERALDLQNVIKRSESVEQIGLKVQRLLESVS